MGRGKLTHEEIEKLRQNPYVVSVDEGRIIYSEDFKKLFMRMYIDGYRPGAIFRSAGFDTEVLGSKRVERACARWRELYCSGAMEIPGCKDMRNDITNKTKERRRRADRDPYFSESERIRNLENMIKRQADIIKQQKSEIVELKKDIKRI